MQEVQQDCGKLMLLVAEMLDRNTARMNAQATVSAVTSAVGVRVWDDG